MATVLLTPVILGDRWWQVAGLAQRVVLFVLLFWLELVALRLGTCIYRSRSIRRAEGVR